MRTCRTPRFATFDPLAAQADVRFGTGAQRTGTFEASARQDEQAPQLVFVQFLDRLDEIPVERHVVPGSPLRNLERRKESGRRPVVGERPPQRRRHAIGVQSAEGMTFARSNRGDEIVQPDRPVVVIKGQDGSPGTATASAGLNHGLNIEGAGS